MRSAVIGLGNLLLRDDGVGIRVIEALKKAGLEGVELIDGGTAVFSIPFEDYDRVILVDAVKLPHKRPGEVVVLTKRQLLSGGERVVWSGHSLDLIDILKLLEFESKLPRELYLIGVVPSSIETGLSLSPEVEKSIPRCIETIKSLLDESAQTQNGT
ncbi:MAG: hydrogenase maturation protease [Deferribacteres bacterium]|nr:hydrogenase maturation protease [Deferribacteres bacterium]